MNFLSQTRAYSQLSDEQKQLIKTKVLEGERTPDEWLSFFKQIVDFDAGVDSAKKTLTIGCVGSGVLFVAGIFLTAIVGPIVLLLALAAGIVLGIIAFTGAKVDLPNNFRLFVFPLIAVLREEMEPGQALYLKLDLRGKTLKEKLDPTPRRSTTTKGKESFFKDDWIFGRAPLADGSRLDWNIVDYTRERKITKRSRSGKTKFKTKHKIKTLIDARLALKPEDYLPASLQSSQDGREKVAFKQGEKRNTVRVRRLIVSTDTDAVLDLGQFLSAVGRCYDQVRLNKPDGQ
jgi:hypothetical protein